MQQSSSSPIFPAPAPDTRADNANPTPPRPENRPVSVEVLKARIRRYNGDLDPSSPAFGAALVLIASAEYGQNVDMLARRTGLGRSFVARCARRLIDNGVWEGGRMIAEWEPRNPATGTFWNDVAVAEGKMCRRTGPDGSLEWAPAGFWNKNFHFFDAEADNRLGNHYMDSAQEPDPAARRAGPDEARNEEALQQSGVEPLDDAQVTPIETFLEGTPDAEPDPERSRTSVPEAAPAAKTEVPETAADPAPSLRHVFRDAVWIG